MSVVVAAVVGLGGIAAPVRAAAPTKGGASLSPSARAAVSGVPVELVDRRDEYSQTFANPDGSFRLDQHVAPVRVRDGHGGWHEPDPTLVKDDDGKIHPQWAMSGLVLGGRGPGADLLRMSAHGHLVRVGWPGELPEPVLDGATATYPEVMDGVDLLITATVLGYRQVLVVKSARAAGSAALRRVVFSLDTGDVRMVGDGRGGTRVLDGGGRQLMTGPAGLMWDSAGDAGEAAVAAGRRASVRGLVGAAGGKSGDDGPGPGDGSAVLPVAVTDSSVAVVPDQGVLNGPGTVFPVFIDPSVALDEVKLLALSSTGERHWGSWGSEGKVGFCGSWGGYYCGNGFNSRLFFEFGPKRLVGKHVLDATVRITETWSFSCSPKVVRLARARSQIWSTTGWPGPAAVDQMGDRTVSAGRGSRCDPSQPAAPIAFNDNPGEADENLTATVRAFAAGSFPRLTLMLMAQDETDTEAWKRFDDNPALSVNYVVYPGYARDVGVEQSSTVAGCTTSEASAMTVGSRRPAMFGRVENSTQGTLGEFTAVYDVERKGSAGVWEQYASSEQPTSGARVPARTMTAYRMGWDMWDPSVYRVRVAVRSFYDDHRQYLAGAFGHWCYFTVDSTAPKPPVVVSVSSAYPACTTNDCAGTGGVGQSGTMVVKPAAGDANVVGYRWSLGGGATTVMSGTSLTFAPRVAGTQLIRVEARDVAGRYGSALTYQIRVAGRVPESGRWEVADAMGATAAANTAEGVSGNALTLQGQAGVDARGRRAASVPVGASDHALAFNGTTGYATTTGSTVRTENSFTISAWAYLTGAGHNGTVLAQAGADARTGYHLYYSAAADRWVFNWHWRDGAGVFQAVRASSSAPPVVGAWTHLTGVYNQGAKTMTLYVNGRAQQSVASGAVPPSATTGPMTVGRTSIAAGAYLDYMGGLVDEVRVWQSALTPLDVASAAATQDGDGNNALALTGSWSGDGGASPAPDLSGYHGPMTARGGATVDPDLGAFVLDGVDDAFTATGPVVDETGSFTVSADVLLDTAAINARTGPFKARVAGQATDGGSSWALYYERDADGVSTWNFARWSATGSLVLVTTDSVVDPGQPVTLTGVFDRWNDKVRLFVGTYEAAPEVAPALLSPQQGVGVLGVGASVVASTVTDPLPGQVRQLRLFSGAMTTDQVYQAVVLDEGAP